MNFSFFNKESQPEVFAQISDPESLFSEGLSFEGGVLRGKGGLLIDGKLENVSVISEDGSPIVVSALANLNNCIIQGHHVVIGGKFRGELSADGDVEITDSASILGTINTGGRMLISPLAEMEDVRMRRLLPKAIAAPTEPAILDSEHDESGQPVEA